MKSNSDNYVDVSINETQINDKEKSIKLLEKQVEMLLSHDEMTKSELLKKMNIECKMLFVD